MIGRGQSVNSANTAHEEHYMSEEKKTTSCTTEVYSRVCGFFRPVQNWNKGKKSEHSDKKTYNLGGNEAPEHNKGANDEQGTDKVRTKDVG